MADTFDSIQRTRQSATELGAVVRTMKAIAAANIGQYEQAVASLTEYDHTVSLGLQAYFLDHAPHTPVPNRSALPADAGTLAIVFGSDQGLVGRFNDQLADFVQQTLAPLPIPQTIWAVGERMYTRLADTGLVPTHCYPVPGSVSTITSLVGQLLDASLDEQETGRFRHLYLFHNRPTAGAGYQPHSQRLLPLDTTWQQNFMQKQWPSKNRPQVIGARPTALTLLLNEYLFVSIFKACAESLAGENASRLAAMLRAEKNIGELLDTVNQTYNQMRQNTIDQELFDVISGFEAGQRKDR